jgi:response regulator RpfG family c-di-GMP phosphodiesterase
MANDKILFVDDERNLLDGIQRQFRREFSLTTALSGQEALAQIQTEGPFAVIVSDMRMPGMDGVEFLGKAQEIAPDSVRIMLTGNADVTTAVKAVNEGRIFQFLSKPCPPVTLRHTLQAALEQYRLVTAERELLEQTLHGSVRLLTELLSMVNPVAFGKASRIKRYVKRLVLLADGAGEMKKADLWEHELAAMLSQIGCIVLPSNLMKKVYAGEELAPREREAFNSHPRIAGDLITNVPRLENVARAVAQQNLRYDGSNGPKDGPRGEDIPLGARLLKVALDFDTLVTAGTRPTAAIATLLERSAWYDPSVLQTLETLIGLESKYQVKKVRIDEIRASMILADDVYSTEDQLLISKGFELTDSVIQRLRHFASNDRLRQPICVLVPAQEVPVESKAGASHAVAVSA